jgi:hypothetical protein
VRSISAAGAACNSPVSRFSSRAPTLTGLKLLVHLEEVADLGELVVRDIREVLDVAVARIVGHDSQDLRIRPALVVHPEHPDRPRRDDSPLS